MEYENLIVEIEKGIAGVRINRPPVNAVNADLALELERAMHNLNDDHNLPVC